MYPLLQNLKWLLGIEGNMWNSASSSGFFEWQIPQGLAGNVFELLYKEMWSSRTSSHTFLSNSPLLVTDNGRKRIREWLSKIPKIVVASSGTFSDLSRLFNLPFPTSREVSYWSLAGPNVLKVCWGEHWKLYTTVISKKTTASLHWKPHLGCCTNYCHTNCSCTVACGLLWAHQVVL